MAIGSIEEEALVNKAFDLSDEGLRIIDKEFTIIKANQRYAEITGIEHQLIVGQKCYSLACSRYCNTSACSLLTAIRSKEKFEQTLTLTDQQGQKQHYLFHVLPLTDEEGNVSAIQESFKEITHYKKTELKLSRILESIQQGVWEINDQGTNFFSESMYAMLGCDPVAHDKGYVFFLRRTHPEDLPHLKQAFKTIETPGNDTVSLRIRLRHENENYLWIRFRGSVEKRDKYGFPLAVMGTHTDIDQHVNFEQELQEKEQLLSNLFEISPAGMRIVKNGKVILANELYAKLTGNPLHKIIGSHCGDFLCSNDCKSNCGYQLLENGADALDGEMETQNASGKTYHLQFRVRSLRNEQGVLTSMLQMFWDITDLVKAQQKLQHYKDYLEELIQIRTEELRMSEERLNLAFRATNEGLWDWRLESNQVYFSPQYYRMLGYEPNAFRSDMENWKKRIHHEDLDFVNETIEEHLTSSKKTFIIDFRMQTYNGQYKWIRGRGKAVEWDNDGNITRLIGTHADIDEEKKAVFAIQISEKKFRNIFNSSNDSMIITDLQGNIIETNQTTLQLTELNASELKKLSLTEVFDPRNKTSIDLFLSRLKNPHKKDDILDTRIITNSGKKIYLEVSGKVISYQEYKAFLLISRNVTERTNLQRKLMKAVYETEERERNRFAQDLHDGLGALLSGIKLQISLLNNQKVSLEKREEILQRVKELLSMAAAQSREIANNIKPSELKMLGLVGALKSIAEKISESQTLKIHIKADHFNSHIDDATELILFRVLSELINNTMKHAEANLVKISIQDYDNQILIEYDDNGKGFDFSQERNNKKFGMGLDNIRSRIESIHGKLSYHSVPGKGFSCNIELHQ